jgi:uncharacterized protein YchJ
MPIILATQEAEIEGSRFKASPGKWFYILSQKPIHKKRTGRVAQGAGPEFKL